MLPPTVANILSGADFASRSAARATRRTAAPVLGAPTPRGQRGGTAGRKCPAVAIVKGHVDFYITGGGGWFRRYQQFTQPGAAVVTGFDPFFGFYPAAIPTTQVLASYSVNRPGIDIGAGLAVGALGRGKIFAEAKDDHIYMKGTHTDYIPVTFGFRW